MIDNKLDEEIVEFELDENYVFNSEAKIFSVILENYFIKVNTKNNNFFVCFNVVQNYMFSDVVSGLSVAELRDKYNQNMEDLEFLLASIIDSKVLSNERPLFDLVSENLFIYLTNKCNLSCLHCYRSGDSDNIIDFHVLKNFVKDFKNNMGKHVTISGGEPLMSPNFSNVISYLSSLGLGITVLSNGLLWKHIFTHNTSIVKQIHDIQISLDGFDDETYSLMRGKHFFNSTIENIDWLIENSVKLTILATVHPSIFENKSLYNGFIEFVRHYINLGISFNLTKKILPNKGLLMSSEENNTYFSNIKKLENDIDSNTKAFRFSHFYSSLHKEKNCGWGGLSINHDGNVFLCNGTDEIQSIGNIIEYNCAFFINKAKHSFEEFSVDNIKPCNNCDIKYICNGGCRIDYLDFSILKNRNDCERIKISIYKQMIDYVKILYGIL